VRVREGKKGHGMTKSKRLLKKVMEALIQKHCLQKNPYMIKFKVIFNACSIDYTYIIEFINWYMLNLV
jgi:hypothetical protein